MQKKKQQDGTKKNEKMKQCGGISSYQQVV